MVFSTSQQCKRGCHSAFQHSTATERYNMAYSEWRTCYIGMVLVMVSSVSSVTSPSSSWTDTTMTSSPGVVTANTARDVIATPSARTLCRLVALDPFQHEIIHDMVDVQQYSLIEYILVFPNQSINPLKHNLKHVFKGDTWARISSVHGQTLLSLAFNYGILSLKTLTFGTGQLTVPVEDRPLGCMLQLTEDKKVDAVFHLLMRDFKSELSPSANNTRDQMTLKGEERLCYEMVDDDGRGFAKFVDRCCFRDRITARHKCETQRKNVWLTLLYVLLTMIRFGILAFGPLLFLSTVTGLVREEFPYSVELKDPLIKNIVIYHKDATGTLAEHEVKGRHKLDLRNQSGYPKLREIILNERAPIGTPFRAKFSQYDILVGYKRLLTENRVPVGFWRNVVRNLFFCKLRHIGPFERCCRVDMLRQRTCRHVISRLCRLCRLRSPLPWILLWRKIGLALLIALLPMPYYIRLIIYYKFEADEVFARKEAAQKLGLSEVFENSLIHYFLPTHPLFISIYAIYIIVAVNLAYVIRHSDQGRFRKIIVGSFTDLKNLSWVNVLRMMVANVIWPFQMYGLAGCVVVFVYWPIVLPLTCLVYAIYCLPTVYLTIRMFFYSKRAFLRRMIKRPVKKSYRVRRTVDDSVRYFEAGYLLGGDDDDADDSSETEDTSSRRAASPQRQASRSTDHKRPMSVRSSYHYRDWVANSQEVDNVTNVKREKMPAIQRGSSIASTVFTRVGLGQARVRRFIEHCLASALCVAGLYSVLILLSECIGCLIEVLVFTLMGIIVNAGSLLKFVALAIMLVVYSYDCFNNVEKKYLKLNKALFSEVKGRIKDLEKVTSLPSFLQENRGFKSQELSEQADYESSDDVADKPARHWFINDLVLFIDNEDMPRIPRKLFDDVCRIHVAGVPGPIYRGHLIAIKQFFKIVVFIFLVFIVILSFGSVYKVSSTNQMIAALAGGSLPFILRTVMQPEKPDIEIGTVSFKNQMDEIIQNFVQKWPIYDLPFEVYTAEDEERDRQKLEEKEREEGKDRGQTDTGCPRPPTPVRQSHAIVTIDSGLDVVDANHIDVSVPAASTNETSASPAQRVCFAVDTKDDEPEVDIVVYLPNKPDDTWLREWSDLDDEEGVPSVSADDSLDNEVFPL